ncbi:MAG: undecaprenyl diphosphate synthase family protein, partial [Candidatus Aenigmarchaeota archaeon]|nr:undecaprenyl diphosphate synthase family protein [Candidatus Aenigmarchaeota archaeon]
MANSEMSVPQHIALIPDGNRRWAQSKSLIAWKGHYEGAKRAEEIARAAVDAGIKYLTLWGCSYDNLEKRTGEEVGILNRIFRELAERVAGDKKAQEKRVRVSFVGEWQSAPKIE